MASTNKAIRRMLAQQAAAEQAARPSLFEREPGKVNRSAMRMTPGQRKGARGARERSAVAEYR